MTNLLYLHNNTVKPKARQALALGVKHLNFIHCSFNYV